MNPNLIPSLDNIYILWKEDERQMKIIFFIIFATLSSLNAQTAGQIKELLKASDVTAEQAKQMAKKKQQDSDMKLRIGPAETPITQHLARTRFPWVLVLVKSNPTTQQENSPCYIRVYAK